MGIKVGISRCLLGDQVRFDAGHKHDHLLTDVLSKYFEWVPVCPEVEIGMTTPREPVRLVLENDVVRMRGIETQTDWTDQMLKYSREKALHIKDLGISGYIFKSKSPSCGLFGVRGLFASTFCDLAPSIPVEEDERLHIQKFREDFITRVFAYHAAHSA